MPSNQYSAFDKLIEGVQIISPDWRYIYINDTVAIQGKSSREALLGCTMMEKYPGIENSEMFALLKKCMDENMPCQMVNEFDFPDGSKGYFELRMQPVEAGVLILSFDVTQQKIAEKLLRHTNILLDDKVKQRTSQLTKKNKELEHLTYIASHDIQEPIRTVANYIHVLKEDYKQKLDSTAVGYLNAIHRATKRMDMLAKALLDFSRLGNNKQRTEVNCYDLIHEVIDDLQDLIQHSGAVLMVGEMPTLNVYEMEFRQLFQNLISNAIKFRHKERPPVIIISAEPVPDKWRFCISDNGIGIDPVYHERIFFIFQRLHLKEVYEGNGIGLANCKKIVEAHEGDIWVESAEGQGSKFIFTISKL